MIEMSHLAVRVILTPFPLPSCTLLSPLCFCRVLSRDENSLLTLFMHTHPLSLSLHCTRFLFCSSCILLFTLPHILALFSAVGWDLFCLPWLMSLISCAEQLLAPQVVAAGAVNWCLWVKGARTEDSFRDGQLCRFSSRLFALQLGWLPLLSFHTLPR